jgi:hypothetical protein
LRFGLKEIKLKHKIIDRDSGQLIHEKFNDRMHRKGDYAINDKLRSVEIFYLNQKISYLGYFVAILKIYTWCLEITWKLRLENKFKQENELFNEIIKNRNVTVIIFFLIFIRNFFSKRIIFFLKILLARIFNLGHKVK